jgi:hypothetical protein
LCTDELQAGAFYDFSVTLIPHGLPQELTDHLLSRSDVSVLVAEAGALNLDEALPKCKLLKQVILVAKPDNKHMAWDETPMPSGVEVATWHDVVEQSSASSEVPAFDKDSPKPKPLTTFFLNTSGEMEAAQFTSDVRTPHIRPPGSRLTSPSTQNIVSGISALITTLPRSQPLSSTDIVLPTSNLTTIYPLTYILASLYSNASIALNSVSGPDAALFSVVAGAGAGQCKPTILITTAPTLSKYLKNYTRTGLGVSRLGKFWHRRSLAQGVMPKRKPIPDLNGKDAFALVMDLQALVNVRAMFVAQEVGAVKSKGEALDGKTLDELRVELGMRIGYALTDGRVAGAVAQTNIADFRNKKEVVCVGPPIGSVEVFLKGEEKDIQGSLAEGQVSLSSSSLKILENLLVLIDDCV